MNASVISAAFWYKPEQLRAFLRSAKEHIPFARIILLCERHDKSFARAVRQLNPATEIHVPADSLLRRILWRATGQSARFGERISRLQTALHRPAGPWFHALFLHIALARYVYALSLLRKDSSDFALVSDSRDVVFQSNPFEGIGECLVTGEEPISIGACPINSGWMRTVYGQPMLDQLAAWPVLCSGVTLGPLPILRQYLSAMVAEMMRLAPQLYFTAGYDQAIHNKLLRLAAPAPLRISPNGLRHIATLHYSKLDEFQFDPEAGLLTRDGHPVSIVHQYERDPAMKEWFARRYE